MYLDEIDGNLNQAFQHVLEANWQYVHNAPLRLVGGCPVLRVLGVSQEGSSLFAGVARCEAAFIKAGDVEGKVSPFPSVRLEVMQEAGRHTPKHVVEIPVAEAVHYSENAEGRRVFDASKVRFDAAAVLEKLKEFQRYLPGVEQDSVAKKLETLEKAMAGRSSIPGAAVAHMQVEAAPSVVHERG